MNPVVVKQTLQKTIDGLLYAKSEIMKFDHTVANKIENIIVGLLSERDRINNLIK